MVIALIIIIAVVIIIKFSSSLAKDKQDLHGTSLSEKFNIIVNLLNEAAYDGFGSVTKISDRQFNLYKNGSNQIIQFHYSSGHLTIIWKYKFFQKEIKHERQFDDCRNLSIFEQQKIAEQMINEMENVMVKLQNEVFN
jgi:hypothetical protein